ncbi:MAG: MFS transporter [Dehalococcoidia bacterium]|nr:MFS transporter [Dehalococcoidia bacterium]
MKIKLKLTPFLLLCLSGGLAIFSSTMAKNPALPLFIRSMGVPVSMVGFIAAASTIVGIVVSLPAGMLSDVIGRRRVLLAAAFVFATAPFLYLLITASWHLVAVRIYHGLATAILGPVALAAVADTYSSGRGERIAWYSSATMIGRFLAPFAGGLLIFGDNFRWIYIADGVAGVLALLAISRLRFATVASTKAKEAFRQHCRKYGQEIAFIFHHGGILATSGIEAVQYFAFGCMETFLPIYLNETHGYPAWQIGILFTVQILAAAFSKPAMGRLSDRFGRIPLISIGLLLGGIAASVMLLWSNYAALLLLMALFGLGLATVTASTSALVADMSRSEGRGGAMGVLSSIMDIGQAAGPMVAGILLGVISYQTTFALVGLLMAMSAALFAVLMRRRHVFGGAGKTS